VPLKDIKPFAIEKIKKKYPWRGQSAANPSICFSHYKTSMEYGPAKWLSHWRFADETN